MTPDELTALCGVITSLLFSYFPVISEWFYGQAPNIKRLLQIAVAVVVVGVVFGLSCAGVLSAFTCDWPGGVMVLRLILIFVIANQTAYAVSPR